MADSKITALASIGTGTDPANDPLVIVDVSDVSPGGMSATGTTKKVTLNNLLACSPTATLASATISGDLTVDTNVLKVDTTNNRVGINTASPIDALHVVGSARLGSTNFIGIGADASGSYVESTVGTHVLRFNTTGSERYRLDSTGVATWSNVGGVAGTAMTLNSTGLGVGVVPSFAKFEVNGGASFTRFGINAAASNTTSTSQSYCRITTTGADFYIGTESSTAGSFFPNSVAYSACLYNANSTPIHFYTGGTLRATIDTSGNLILRSSATPATLATNGELTVNATSNTNLRFSYRGSDGVTRVANLTLA